MESSKQQSIIQLFQKKPNSENQVSSFNRKEKESITLKLLNDLKRLCDVDIDHAETSKKETLLGSMMRCRCFHAAWAMSKSAH